MGTERHRARRMRTGSIDSLILLSDKLTLSDLCGSIVKERKGGEVNEAQLSFVFDFTKKVPSATAEEH